MSIEKVNEFKTNIQGLITENGEQTFSKRIYWKDFPEKITNNATQVFNITSGETIIMMLDASIMGSGKEGMAITDWGIRYNDGVAAWKLTWNDLKEKYAIVKTEFEGGLGVKGDAILLRDKTGNISDNKTINLSMADIKYDLLAQILDKTCLLFTGEGVDLTDFHFEQKIETDPNTFNFDYENFHTVITLEGDAIVIKKFKVDDKTKIQTPKGTLVTISRSAIASVKAGKSFAPLTFLKMMGAGMALFIGLGLILHFIVGLIAFLLCAALGLRLAFPKTLIIIRKDGTKFTTRMYAHGPEYERFLNTIF
jgi:hypothetical protein